MDFLTEHSEMDENQAPADVDPKIRKFDRKIRLFRRRVEDAAATLRSGKSTQQRRRISTNAADFHAMHVKRAQLKFRNKRHGSLLHKLQLHLGQASGEVKLFRVHLFELTREQRSNGCESAPSLRTDGDTPHASQQAAAASNKFC